MAKRVLVLYYTRGVYPLRDAIRTHIYCWRRYGRHHVSFLNVAFGFPERVVRDFAPDVIVLHTIYCSMRWSTPVFEKFTDLCRAIEDMNCIKIALPQDEFIYTDMLASYLGRVKVTHIATCAYEQDWRKIYAKLWDTHPDPESVVFRTVLTGYLDEDTVRRIDAMQNAGIERDIDIGYRAWRAEYWLGEHGMHKVWVADRSEAAGKAAGLKCDISLRNEDVLNGDDWFRFLMQCRTTVGVEGGASLCDNDGSVRASVNAYLTEHPAASFEEVRAACFPDRDHTLALQCISPRHLEACATKTAQALIEGRFSDILEAGVDYIPIKKDYSNIQQVVAQIKDESRCREVAENAYRRIVASGRWTYRAFVANLEQEIIDLAPSQAHRSRPVARVWAALQLRFRDWRNWTFIRYEVYYLAHLQTKPSKWRDKFYGMATRLMRIP